MAEKSAIIAVSGSIAAYKTCYLVSLLVKEGISVRVIMTENACRFVTPLTFESLSGNKVFTSEWEGGMPHIDTKRNASVFAIVPATANCIGKTASGIADDIVTSSFLAANCPKFIAPAMNPDMYQNTIVQENITRLEKAGVKIIRPATGKVICGDEGVGKLEEPENILKILLPYCKS